MPAVRKGIGHMMARYIKLLYNAAKQANIKAQFAARGSFLNVIGNIDCKHIAINAPYQDKDVYVNGKHFHSVHVQFTCEAQMQLTNMARWPGSMNNLILMNSMNGN